MAREKIIVVGAGSIAGAWFPAIKAEELQVVAVVDLRQQAAEEALAKFELPNALAYDDLSKALAQQRADLVLDLTIPEAHCEVTCKALAAGCHVLGEKPMAATMGEARQMVKMAEESGRIYKVSQSRRYDIGPEKIVATLAAGDIGPLTMLNCDFFMGVHIGGFREQMASPLILDMAIHHFDLARTFSGQDAVSVYAEEFNPRGSWYKGDVATNCLFEMTGGVRFAYRASWCAEGCHTGWHGDWRITGEHGTLLLTGDTNVRGEVVCGTEGLHRPMKAIEVRPIERMTSGFHESLRDMLNAIRTGAVPQSECHDNIKSLAMVMAAIESSRRGTRVKLSEIIT